MTPAARNRLLRLGTRIAISAIPLVLLVLHIAGNPRFEIIDRVENYLYDVRVRLTMPGTVDDQIVIVDIDEASQLALGQWPWPRDTLARIVDKLFDTYEISVLGLDVLFAEAEETSSERLLQALAASPLADNEDIRRELLQLGDKIDSNTLFSESFIARDVVTGFVFKNAVAPDEPAATGALPAPIIKAAAISDVAVAFVEAPGYTGNLPALQENAVAGGFFDAPLIDSDGVFRRAPLVQRYHGDLYPSLALAVARLVMGAPAVGLQFAGTGSGRKSGIELESFLLGDAVIPVDQQVAVYIPFRGPQESFRYVSAKDVLSESVDPELLRSKIVLLGASAAGLLDLRATPVGQRYIGVEAHANLIAGLLDHTIRRQPSYSDGLELFVLIVIGLLCALWLPRLAPGYALLLLATLIFAELAGNLWMWSSHMLVLPIASLLAYTIIVSLLQITYGFFVEQRNKRHLSEVFGQYIPPSLVEEIDRSGEKISLEGETREMSVLFSDVRGFTTISEGLDARELTTMMNEFLTPFTYAIQKHRGTIDKYMGDAVMAFWGAPLTDEEHARHALLSAFDMLDAVRSLDESFGQKGWPEIRVGVGIASGDMRVGNMGSEFRIAYTVMGDTVNLGSRLEGLTKQYGVDIIVNDRTSQLVPDFAFRELDLVRVKGKQEPVAIYEPIGFVRELTETQVTLLEQHAQALGAYRLQQWNTAHNMFNTLNNLTVEPLYSLYLERIERFQREPPPATWDGVFDHLSK
ncbi:MAG TPA: adenylate/guanylate cyclase domain-containing protein [Woeseiaceae bacterium]|nr:adenylate/guanylate cyclase domain-containing protein [Woeseiaceae bacterium]